MFIFNCFTGIKLSVSRYCNYMVTFICFKFPFKSIYDPKLILTRIDVHETLCPQQMPEHKGSKIKNWSGECRDVIPTNLQFFFLWGGGGRVGGGGGGSG